MIKRVNHHLRCVSCFLQDNLSRTIDIDLLEQLPFAVKILDIFFVSLFCSFYYFALISEL